MVFSVHLQVIFRFSFELHTLDGVFGSFAGNGSIVEMKVYVVGAVLQPAQVDLLIILIS